MQDTHTHTHTEGKTEFNHRLLKLQFGRFYGGRRKNKNNQGTCWAGQRNTHCGSQEWKDGSLSIGHGNLGKKQQRESHFTGGNRRYSTRSYHVGDDDPSPVGLPVPSRGKAKQNLINIKRGTSGAGP